MPIYFGKIFLEENWSLKSKVFIMNTKNKVNRQQLLYNSDINAYVKKYIH